MFIPMCNLYFVDSLFMYLASDKNKVERSPCITSKQEESINTIKATRTVIVHPIFKYYFMKFYAGLFSLKFPNRKRKVISFLKLIMIAFVMHLNPVVFAQQDSAVFQWPQGKRTAVSLTFDDARESQVIAGTNLLDQYGIKATFFVVPAAMEKQLDGWKKAAANGHEIGNHSLTHPCTGNFTWSRTNALEDYTLEQMKNQLAECNKRIEELLHVKPEVFAYPCGQKFVGKGINTKSYVPLVAEMFVAGRGWLDEAPNDPVYDNFAQLTGMEMDGKDFEQLLPLLEEAKSTGMWLVLAGHEMGDSGTQTTRLAMLKKLIEYAQDPSNGIWIEPMGTVAKYIKEHKK